MACLFGGGASSACSGEGSVPEGEAADSLSPPSSGPFPIAGQSAGKNFSEIVLTDLLPSISMRFWSLSPLQDSSGSSGIWRKQSNHIAYQQYVAEMRCWVFTQSSGS